MSIFNENDNDCFRKKKRYSNNGYEYSELSNSDISGGARRVYDSDSRVSTKPRTDQADSYTYLNGLECTSPVRVKQEPIDTNYVFTGHTDDNIHDTEQSESGERKWQNSQNDELRLAGFFEDRHRQQNQKPECVSSSSDRDVKPDYGSIRTFRCPAQMEFEDCSPPLFLPNCIKREQNPPAPSDHGNEEYTPNCSYEYLNSETWSFSHSPIHRSPASTLFLPLEREYDFESSEASNNWIYSRERDVQYDRLVPNKERPHNLFRNYDRNYDNNCSLYAQHQMDAKGNVGERVSRFCINSTEHRYIRTGDRAERPNQNKMKSSYCDIIRAKPYPDGTSNRFYDRNVQSQSQRRDTVPRQNRHYQSRSRADNVDSGQGENQGNVYSRVRDNRTSHSERSHDDFRGVKDIINSNMGLSEKTIVLPSTFKPPKGVFREEDTTVLMRRQKQIDYMKVQEDYEKYRQMLPKEKRELRDPKTPDKFQILSRRCWDSRVQNWKLQVHAYVTLCSDDQST